MDLHDERRTGEACDRCDVTDEIEIELVVGVALLAFADAAIRSV
jgi:hypothetical protein